MRSTERPVTFCTADKHITDGTEPREVVLTVHGSTITFRGKGRRKAFTISIAQAMRHAIESSVTLK